MSDIELLYDEWLDDEVYTGKSLKRLRRKKKKPKKEPRKCSFAEYLIDYANKRQAEYDYSIPNRIKCPMRYGDECYDFYWRDNSGLFRASPMGDILPWFSRNRQYYGSHRVLYRKFMKLLNSKLYFRRMHSFQASKGTCGYEKFSRAKRNYSNMPNPYDDVKPSVTHYKTSSWKYLSKFKKQWSKW